MPRQRTFWFLTALLLLGWGVFALGGHLLADVAAARLGDALLRFGRGKITDPATFIHARLGESLWLATLLLVWILIQQFSERRLHHTNATPTRRWVVHTTLGFIALNVWVAFAMRTVLFWGVLGAGAGHENFTQFQFKRLLAAEISAPQRAVLVGSSQTRAQIDEQLLNERLGTELWTTELHFPGSKASDLLVIEPQLAIAKPDLVICYVTVGYFFNGASGETVPNFLTLAQLGNRQEREALHFIPSGEVGYGLLGNVLPLFRCRVALCQRLLGPTLMQLRQSQYDAALDPDLDARASKTAPLFRRDACSEFQKRALEEFITRCGQSQRRVILLVGGYHPALARRIDPELRPDMLQFLKTLESRHANLRVIPESELPVQAAADYDDLNHANLDMQRRFTEALVPLLQAELPPPDATP